MAGGFGSAPQIGSSAGGLFGSLGSLAKMASPIGAALSFAPSLFKFFSGNSQVRQANRLHPVEPQFQMNQGIIDNARVLGNRYNNYQMAGYGQAQNNLQTNFSNAFSQGIQGASSGADVLDLATKLNYGQGQGTNQLAFQNAQGKDQALLQSLDANASAGNELVKKNMYDLQEYQRKLQEKAALLQAGKQNMFSAGDDVASGLGSLLQPRETVTQGQNSTMVKGLGSSFNWGRR